MAQDYNATLNLPETAFQMRAGLPQKEPENPLAPKTEEELAEERAKKEAAEKEAE